MFWRLIAAYGLILVGAIALPGWILKQRIIDRELKGIEEQLHSQATLVQQLIARVPQTDLQSRIRALSAEQAVPLRITLLSESGRILADSSMDSVQESDLGDRLEFQRARITRFGSDVRAEDPEGEDWMHVALSNNQPDSPVRFIRVALPLDRVQVQLNEIRDIFLATAGLALLTALLLSAYLSRVLARPIEEVTRAAENIAEGSYGQKVFTSGQGEISRLAETFNRMSMSLATQINQLEEDQQQLRAILSGMVEGVVALDAEQRILFANDRAAHLLDFAVSGHSTQSVVGCKLWDLVRQRSLLDLVRDASTQSEPQKRELNWNGVANRFITVHAARLLGRPPRGSVLVLHDTSELRRLERLRHEFVANVSHELKTPLAVIKACVETLLDGGAEDPTHCRRFLEQVDDQAERLHRLILDLLSLARIESGAETFVFQSVPISKVVERCHERHHTRSEARNQTFTLALSQERLWAWADEEAVGEILDNLIDNAVKYTPLGGSIQIRCWGESNWVCMEVKDTGIGIPEKDLPRIFERFYRVDKARSRELGGTGLGLSIVKHLVQSMRGSISVESVIDRGTCFVVRLPRMGGEPD